MASSQKPQTTQRNSVAFSCVGFLHFMAYPSLGVISWNANETQPGLQPTMNCTLEKL